MDQTAKEFNKDFRIKPKEICDAHDKGVTYIIRLRFPDNDAVTCCRDSLDKLFKRWI